jgi:hypothetical protein
MVVQGDASGGVVLIVLILVFLYVVNFMMWAAQSLYHDVHKDDTARVVWDDDAGEWVDSEGQNYVKKWGPFFEDYKPENYCVFFLVAVTLPMQLLRGMIIGWLGNDDQAGEQASILIASYVIEFVLFVTLKPQAVGTDNLLSAASAFEMAAILSLSFWTVDDKCPAWVELIMLILAIGTIFLHMAIVIFTNRRAIRNCCSSCLLKCRAKREDWIKKRKRRRKKKKKERARTAYISQVPLSSPSRKNKHARGGASLEMRNMKKI